MITRQKIMVTGASGQLGKELQALAPQYAAFEIIFLAKEDLPVHKFAQVRKYFSDHRFQYLINCAAYTAVDRAESEKELTFEVNAEAVGVLADICREQQAGFIHISTDYVFDGLASEPYSENAATAPRSVYGASKLEGEQQAQRINSRSIIIRSSWLYSEYGKNFVRTMLRLLREKSEINVVSDQVGSPTYAGDLAAAILEIIASRQWKEGIYHFCNSGTATWYELALAIREISGSDCKINPIPGSQYPTAASRPGYSVLDASKIRQTYGIAQKDWRDRLAYCLGKMTGVDH